MYNQLKGKHHVRYMRQMAMSLWQKTGFIEGQFPACLRAAFSKHRKAIYLTEQKRKLIMQCCILCRKELDESEKEYLVYYCTRCFNDNHVNRHAFAGN